MKFDFLEKLRNKSNFNFSKQKLFKLKTKNKSNDGTKIAKSKNPTHHDNNTIFNDHSQICNNFLKICHSNSFNFVKQYKLNKKKFSKNKNEYEIYMLNDSKNIYTNKIQQQFIKHINTQMKFKQKTLFHFENQFLEITSSM